MIGGTVGGWATFGAMLRVLLIVVMVAAQGEEVPLLPDPYGLGQRLVLIDHLRNRGVAVPERASDDELRALYRRSLVRAVPAAASPELVDGTITEAARRRDAIARLRRTLAQRYGVEAPADAGEDELRALLAEHTAQTERERLEDAERFMEQQRQRAEQEAAAAELTTHTDEPSGITWVLPRLTSAYEERSSPYATCLFGRDRAGEATPLHLRLVVFLPEPPSGEPRILLHGGDLTLPLSAFTFTAAATGHGTLRAEAGFVVPSAGTLAALRLLLERSDPAVEYRIGQRDLLVPISDDQRRAMLAVIGSHPAQR